MDYYNEIKNELINNEVYKKVKDYSKNRNDLTTYYNVGKIIIEAQGGEEKAKYGDSLIKDYSKRLTQELGKGYSTRNLKYMRKFYLFQKGQSMIAQLSWTHYIQILSINNINEINYYIKIVVEQNLSVRELQNKIKHKEYERLDENTKNKLIINKKEKQQVEDFIKHPIIINNRHHYQEISEKILKQLILEDIENFLIELGEGFTYIKIKQSVSLFVKKIITS